MANVYSNGTGQGANFTGESLNNTRRKFDFGDRVAELAPQQSPFFVYLNKVAKKPTNDPVFKFLEQRHQWQRRNFKVAGTAFADASGTAVGVALGSSGDDLKIASRYDNYGNIASSDKSCPWIIPGAVLALELDGGAVQKFKISETATVETTDSPSSGAYITHRESDDYTLIAGETLIPLGDALAAGAGAAIGNKGQVIGSAWAEGTDSPVGWEDKLFDREGYTQIFKTGMNMFSGTALATEYRGIKNEFQRIWTDKLMEHKMDLEHAFLFGVGGVDVDGTIVGSVNTTSNLRTTHGIIPYTESYGKVYNMSYASSGYDAFLDAMEDFFAPEGGNSGNKLVLCSRKVITYLNKMGSGSFLNNTVGSSQYRLDVQNIKGSFGHQVTMVNTIFGNLHFIADPLLRGPWENYCAAVDMKNVAYRPLVGNGISRDTFIETNVQDNGVDGRQDMVLTEAGLEISLPETHAVLKFS